MSIQIGSINEKGLLNDFNRKGFTYEQCFGEIISNSIDADAKDIKFVCVDNEIIILDNGIGMTEKNVKNMFDLHRQNHENATSMGVSGIGGKIATQILSEKQNIKIYTKNKNEDGYIISVPWLDIYTKERYTGMVLCEPIGDDTEFEKLMRKYKMDSKYGTIIYIKKAYNKNITDCLKNYIRFPDSVDKLTEISNIPQIIFGKFDTNIYHIDDCDDNDNIDSFKMKKYDYFNKECDFIKEVDLSTIHIFKNKLTFEYVYVEEYSGEYYYCKKVGKAGYKKDIIKLDNDEFMKKYVNHVDVEYITSDIDIQVKTGIQNVKEYFNKENPGTHYDNNKNSFTPNDVSNSKIYPECDNIFFEKKNEENEEKSNSKLPVVLLLTKIFLRRNKQIITGIHNENAGSLRGGGNSSLKFLFIRQEIDYQVYSSQNNNIDIIVNIQSNKGQHCHTLDVPFKRLLDNRRNITYEKIKKYMKKKYEIAFPEPKQKSKQEPEPEQVLEQVLEQELILEPENEPELVLEQEPESELKPDQEPEPEHVPEPEQKYELGQGCHTTGYCSDASISDSDENPEQPGYIGEQLGENIVEFENIDKLNKIIEYIRNVIETGENNLSSNKIDNICEILEISNILNF
jgi:hypothetical protein